MPCCALPGVRTLQSALHPSLVTGIQPPFAAPKCLAALLTPPPHPPHPHCPPMACQVAWRPGVNLVLATDLQLRTVQLWQDTAGTWQWDILPRLSWGSMRAVYGESLYVDSPAGYTGPICTAVDMFRANRFMAFNPAGTVLAMFCHTRWVGVRLCMWGLRGGGDVVLVVAAAGSGCRGCGHWDAVKGADG